MKHSYRLFVEALSIRFMHIQEYELTNAWSIQERRLPHSVLWLVREGIFQATVNGTSYKGSAGELLLLPTDAVLSCRGVSSRIKLISINFEAEITFLNTRPWTELLHIPVAHSRSGRDLTPIVEDMLSVASQPSMGQYLLLQSGMQRMIALLLNHTHDRYDEPAGESRIGIDSRVQTVIEYLASHLDRMPEVPEMCELAHTSVSYLRKLFVQYTGLPPLVYMHQFKMTAAKRRLSATEDRISEIALQLGYRDVNHFSRLFKKAAGMPPVEYRRRNRQWRGLE